MRDGAECERRSDMLSYEYDGYRAVTYEGEGGWYRDEVDRAGQKTNDGPYETELACYRAWRRKVSVLRRHP
jgi:hypothetical protein